MRVTFVSSAYNEGQNIPLLYEQCLKNFNQLMERLPLLDLSFRMILVDNCSMDNTSSAISNLSKTDPRVLGISNIQNYGPEPSFVQGLKLAKRSDLIVLLCADLQDPPEVAVDMICQLINSSEEVDAVVACKTKSSGSSIIQLCRKIYYKLLRYSNRDSKILPGYHGFGCYKSEVIKKALYLWKTTPMNLRDCLSASMHSPYRHAYIQHERIHGKSSYSLSSYVFEASRAISSGKSLASRTSLRIGLLAFILSICLTIFIVVNYSFGNSGYASGIPSIAVIIMLSSAFQFVMLSLISRQIEQGFSTPTRPRTKYFKL